MKPWRPQNHPHLGDTRSREADKIKLTRDRAKLVEARCDSHGAHDLQRWCRDVAAGWGGTDRSEALAIIKRKLGQDAWRVAVGELAW